MKDDRPEKSYSARIKIDLSRIPEDQFAPDQPLRVAAIRDGEVIDEAIVTPGKEDDPRAFEVSLDIGPPRDGVAGAKIVAAPADDERNLFSSLAADTYVAGTEATLEDNVLTIHPGIYQWWRFCWFPRDYRITGRVVRHEDDCTHPVGAANVEIYDVDYCWWWYDEDLITTGTTDPDGFFDITFTWCTPLWCLAIPRKPPLYVDPDLRWWLWERVRTRIPVGPIPPDDPRVFEEMLAGAGVSLPGSLERAGAGVRPRMRAVEDIAVREFTPISGSTSRAVVTEFDDSLRARLIPWDELFGGLIRWPICTDPCDWRPDIRIRVTQDQPDAGTVEIYRDSFSDIRWNLDDDLLNLSLEANEDALYGDECRPDPLLGNCMLFERVGGFNVSTIYQPDLPIPAPGASYGATPDRKERMGRTVSMDRPWCLTLGVHGDFGLAAQVDYYQIEIARWTPGDLTAWETNSQHVPPDSAFSPVSPDALVGFVRQYAELHSFPVPHYKWKSEGFSPQTVGGVAGVYKSRRRFEQEYRDSHGGNDPAPDYASGWFWDTSAMTRLFNIDTSKLLDGTYTFRIVGYTQTGVDAGGQPILAHVNMGLANGVCRRCGGPSAPNIPDLLTVEIVNNPHRPTCSINAFRINGVEEIDECEIIVLGETDLITMEFEASDPKGNLESYGVVMQRGASSPVNLLAQSGVTLAPASGPAQQQGQTYPAALTQGATAPYWYGGVYTATVPASVFAALGGSCAYRLTLSSWDRHTNGYSVGAGWSEVHCGQTRAFTVILAADREFFCAQLDCDEFCPEPGPPGQGPGGGGPPGQG